MSHMQCGGGQRAGRWLRGQRPSEEPAGGRKRWQQEEGTGSSSRRQWGMTRGGVPRVPGESGWSITKGRDPQVSVAARN